MIDDLIAAWREDGIPRGTHYENCGKHHARCAISLLATEVEYLRALITKWADAVDSDERDEWVASEIIWAETELRKAVKKWA